MTRGVATLPTRTSRTSRTSRTTRTTRNLTRHTRILPQDRTQHRGIIRSQINLVLQAIKTKANCLLRFFAVKIVYQLNLYSLHHFYFLESSGESMNPNLNFIVPTKVLYTNNISNHFVKLNYSIVRVSWSGFLKSFPA
jgi:hypothetical protein